MTTVANNENGASCSYLGLGAHGIHINADYLATGIERQTVGSVATDRHSGFGISSREIGAEGGISLAS